ncbi:MAG: hypothetical protein COB67_03960 [SAR324 cluster bacterium]|uniref:Uncharacterized protein n=1 Tax=SAR324 cluster bacterium TaxID=2024889 RepID=A0A2A4T788_9DELT|nr:MAG: hypothetical protein COB67_03960 [SAR324 cluster bacterium]
MEPQNHFRKLEKKEKSSLPAILDEEAAFQDNLEPVEVFTHQPALGHDIEITHDIYRAVNDAQLLVNYIAYQGQVTFIQETLETVILSKFLLEEKQWNAEIEIKFWHAYENLSSAIAPVTVESLKATMPLEHSNASSSNSPPKTKAVLSVSKYRKLTFCSLFLLLFVQIYWIIGTELHQNQKKGFAARETLYLKVDNIESYSTEIIREKSSELERLKGEILIINQKMNGNYELLLSWGRFWQTLVGQAPFQAKVTQFEQDRYLWQQLRANNEGLTPPLTLALQSELSEKKYGRLSSGTKKQSANRQQIEKIDTLERRYELSKSRNKLFLTGLTAEFVLLTLQQYLLPLLYGLLGAGTFVLRSLTDEVKNLTFCHESDIKYRLRLPLGALSGMTIGWFLTPEDVSFGGSAAPMALAFLAGYNVEILFSLMDKLSEKLIIRPKKTVQKKEVEQQQTE